jgi:tRNA (cmo5U34)-methyltransferase
MAEAKQFHFSPDTFLDQIREVVPYYDEMQDAIAEAAASVSPKRFVDLGSGTGETALRLLRICPDAHAVLVEEQQSMVEALQERLSEYSPTIVHADFGCQVPEGPFCAAVSLYAVHHLKGQGKKELFEKVHSALEPGGVWVFGDVFTPADPSQAKTPVDPACDFPSPLPDVEQWLGEVGFFTTRAWERFDSAVLKCDKRR